jgi:hypothetical protein
MDDHNLHEPNILLNPSCLWPSFLILRTEYQEILGSFFANAIGMIPMKSPQVAPFLLITQYILVRFPLEIPLNCDSYSW